MPITNFPQGLSSFGMPVLPVGGLGTVGNVFWVNSLTGTDANGRGTDPTRPFKTINFALTKCNATGGTNPQKPGGDFILAMPGHLEQISVAGSSGSPSGSISVNVAGVTIIGLGAGTSRPTIQWSATAGQMLIAANNVSFFNLLFDACSQINTVVAAINITGTRCSFRSCEFQQSNATNSATNFITLATGWAFFLMEDCISMQLAGGSTGAANFISAAAGDNLILRRMYITGQYSAAIITTGTNIVTEITVDGWSIFSSQASNKPIILTSNSSTGRFNECLFQGNTWGSAAGVLTNSTGITFRQCFGQNTNGGGGAANAIAAPAVKGGI